MKFDFIFMNVFFLALATTFTLLGIEASEAPGTLAQSTSTLMYLMASMNAIAVTFLDFLEIKIFLKLRREQRTMKNFIIALIFSIALVIGSHGQYATPVNTTLDVILIIALTAGFKALIDSEEGKF